MSAREQRIYAKAEIARLRRLLSTLERQDAELGVESRIDMAELGQATEAELAKSAMNLATAQADRSCKIAEAKQAISTAQAVLDALPLW